MMLVDSRAQGTVNCVVVTSDGVSHQVGTFVAKEGYGAWVAPLTVDPKDIRSAEVVVAQRDGDRHRRAGLTPRR